jgi:hypothetical protein
MADDSNNSGDSESTSPASDTGDTERQERGDEQGSVSLSIEEKAIVVMPEMPDPTMQVDVGGAPPAEAPSPGPTNSGDSADGGDQPLPAEGSD